MPFTPPPQGYGAPMQNGETMPFTPPLQGYGAPMQNGETMPFTPPLQGYGAPMQNGETMPFTPPPQGYGAPMQNGETMPFTPQPGYYPPQTPPPAQPMPLAENKPPKKPRKIKGWLLALIIAGGILVLAGLIVGGFFLVDALTHRNVDLSQMYTIKVEGYDGYADAVVETTEWDALEVFGSEERAFLAPTLSVTLDKTENIANGDTVTATVHYDEVYAERVGVRFQNVTFSVTVEGLAEAIVFDPFEGVFLNTQGISPAGKVTVEGGNNELFSYYIDSSSRYFKNGDVVTVVASYNEDEIYEAGGVVLQDRADFEVSEMPEYITTKEQLTQKINTVLSESTSAKMKDRLADNAYSIIYEIDSEKFSFLADVSIENIELDKTYLSYRREPRDWGTFNNVHHLYVMDVVLKQDGKSETFKMYALATARNIVLETDGSLRPLDTDVEFYMSSCFDADENYLYEQNIGSLGDDWAIVEIKY